jgi:hypothetical protein
VTDIQARCNDIVIYIFVSAMEVLDGDDVRLSSRGKYAERDIVQVG